MVRVAPALQRRPARRAVLVHVCAEYRVRWALGHGCVMRAVCAVRVLLARTGYVLSVRSGWLQVPCTAGGGGTTLYRAAAQWRLRSMPCLTSASMLGVETSRVAGTCNRMWPEAATACAIGFKLYVLEAASVCALGFQLYVLDAASVCVRGGSRQIFAPGRRVAAVPAGVRPPAVQTQCSALQPAGAGVQGSQRASHAGLV